MSTSVFVRGFDFGTSEQEILEFCSQAGDVGSVEMWGRGAAVVTYTTNAQAKDAVNMLNQSTIGSNTRYVDVKLNDESKGREAKKASGPKKRGISSVGEPSCNVFVRGFDFGTTDEQFEGHMSQAGTVEKVRWVTKGSAIVTYSSAEEAQNAVDTLQATTIEGNGRYIDVIMKEEGDDGMPAAKKSKFGAPPGGKAGGKSGQWVWMPALASVFSAMTGKGGAGKGGKAYGKGGKEDPQGSGRVFVRGFDFGTPDNQFMNHMKKAGPIHTVHWCSKGSAVVVYKSKAAAVKASNVLNGTTLPGNSRYIDVILKDSE